MQANLAYLASLAERHTRPTAQQPPWPAILTAPAGHEKLGQMYTRLQELFPMWKAARARAQQQQAAGGGQGAGGMMQQQMGGQGVQK